MPLFMNRGSLYIWLRTTSRLVYLSVGLIIINNVVNYFIVVDGSGVNQYISESQVFVGEVKDDDVMTDAVNATKK